MQQNFCFVPFTHEYDTGAARSPFITPIVCEITKECFGVIESESFWIGLQLLDEFFFLPQRSIPPFADSITQVKNKSN